MEQKIYKANWVKVAIGWMAVFLLRFMPFRPPNFEPVLAVQMPFAKRYGAAVGFAFGFLSIALFDAATMKVGIWTLITGVAYGLLGVGAYFFFRSRKGTTANFLLYSIVATIFYDAATGLTIGPIFWAQPFMAALIGQIPFTLMHLLGNAALAVVLSPAIYRWVATNKSLETKAAPRELSAEKI